MVALNDKWFELLEGGGSMILKSRKYSMNLLM